MGEANCVSVSDMQKVTNFRKSFVFGLFEFNFYSLIIYVARQFGIFKQYAICQLLSVHGI